MPPNCAVWTQALASCGAVGLSTIANIVHEDVNAAHGLIEILLHIEARALSWRQTVISIGNPTNLNLIGQHIIINFISSTHRVTLPLNDQHWN